MLLSQSRRARIGALIRGSVSVYLLGFFSYVLVLMAMRASAGEHFFQPQSDFGILIGAALVSIIVIVRNILASNGKQDT